MDDNTIVHRYATAKKTLEDAILIMKQDGKNYICGEDATDNAVNLRRYGSIRGRGEYAILEFCERYLDDVILYLIRFTDKKIAIHEAQ